MGSRGGSPRLRVCLVINSMVEHGGIQRVVATLANHWVRREIPVTIVSYVGHSECDAYTLEPAVQRASLDFGRARRHRLDGIRLTLRRLRHLRRAVRSSDPTLVILCQPKINIEAGLALVGSPGIVVAGSEHVYPDHMSLGPKLIALRRLVYPMLDFVAVPTAASAARLSDLISRGRVDVIENPIPFPMPRHAEPRAIEDLADRLEDKSILLAVGRLHHQKGFDLLIDAFAEIADAHPDWHLVILGEGRLRSELEDRIAALGLSGRVSLPGVSRDIAGWYARADLYAMSSRYEGFGNALAEALVHGVPAVSFDCESGPADLIEHDKNGWLVPVGNVAALTRALDDLMSDSRIRARFSRRARSLRARLSPVSIAARWQACFERSALGERQIG